MAKVDRAEIYAQMRDRARLAALIVGLLMLVAGGSIVSFRRHKRSQFYRQQYEAELQRRALLEHYDTLTRYANDIILLMDMDGRIIDANDRAARAHGLPREELLKLNIRNIRAAETHGAIEQEMEQIENEGGMVFETVHRRRDGQRFPVETSARLIEIDGKPFLQSIIRDISERKIAERALHESKQMLEFVLDHIPQRVFWKDRYSSYLGCNRPFALDAGLHDPKEIIGKNDTELSWKETAELYRRDDRSVMEMDTAKVGYEEPQHRPDGSQLWLRTSKVPLHNEQGTVIGVLGTYEDITERRKTEERLSRLNECFLGFGPDPLQNINRLVALCGELMGGTCALYAKLIEGMLCTVGQWNAPEGYRPVDRPEGHLCYDLIRRGTEGLMVVRNLPETPYFEKDPNVKAYGLKTYVGRGVQFGESTIGSLCVVYQRDFAPSNDDEKLMGILAAAIGVEEARRREREALRETNETLNAIIASAPLAVYDLDVQGRVKKVWNPTAERMFGWTASEAVGAPLPFVAHEQQPEFMHIFGRLLRGETINGLEVRRTKKDGSLIDLRLDAAPMRDHEGNIIGAMALVGDISEHKRAEHALWESEDRYKRLVESSPNAVVVQVEGRIVFVNDAGVKLIGARSVDDLIGKPIVDVVHADYRDAARAWASAMPADAQEVPFTEKKFVRSDGLVIDVEVASSPVAYGGKPATQVVARDITARKKAEEEIRQWKQRFELVAAASGQVVYDYHLASGHISWSGSVEQVLGYSALEMGGGIRQWEELINPDDRDEALRQLERAQEQMAVYDVDYGFRHRDGHYLLMHDRGMFLPDSSGHPIRMIGIMQDVTEQRKVEKVLRDSESSYRGLFNSVSDAIYVQDREGRFVDVNRGAEEMYGYVREFFFGKTPEFLAAPGKNDLQDTLRRVKKTFEGEPQRFEWWGKRRTGEVFPKEIRLTKGTYFGQDVVIALAEDITERKRAEQQLKDSEEKYRSLFEESKDVVYISTTEGRLLDINPAGVEMFGYASKSELLKIDIQRDLYWDPNDRVRNQNALREAGFLRDYEVELKTKDGRKLICLETSTPMRRENGEIVGYQGILRDITRRKRAEEALLKSEAFLRQVWDSARDGMRILDGMGTIVMANDAYCRLVGMTREELIGKPFTVAYQESAEEDNEDLRKYRHRWSTRTIAPRMEVEVPLHNGERRLVDLSNSFLEAPGQPYQVLSIFHDVTERKRAEEAVHESEMRYRTLIETSQDGISLIDSNGNILFANSRKAQMLGLGGADKLVGVSALDLLVPEERERALRLTQEVFSKGSISNVEFTVLRVDGSHFSAELSATAITDKDGRPTGFMDVMRDISERKKAEQELRESELRFRRVWESTMDGMRIIDESGTIVMVNEAFCRLMGKSRDELVGQPFHVAYRIDSPDEIERDTRVLRERFASRSVPSHLESETVLWNGRKAWLEISNSFLEIEKGRPTVLSIFRDMTERKMLEQQLFHVQKLESIGTLAAGIAHDFNNILAIVLGYASTLDRTGGDPAKIAASVEAITKAVERGAALVRQILTFARKTDFNLEPLNVNALVGELARMLGETFPKTLHLSLQLEKSIPVISMDHSQLHQALLNLCVNARDAMNEHGDLTITTRMVSGDEIAARFPGAAGRHYVMISVADTGIGMDESIRTRVFDPFFTTKEKGKGTGLGLAVVFGVIQAHQGIIDVQSEPGRGSTFMIYLPVPPEVMSKRQAEGARTEDIPGGTETILLVEDEEVLCELAALVLEEKGYRVLPATDGERGVELFQQHRNEIALVLSDMGLPKSNGWEMYKKIKAIDPQVVLLMASGYLEPEVKARILNSGVAGFIQKPYRPEEILNIIRQTLDKKSI